METVANQFIPLALETRTAIPTDAAAHHLNRKSQTLRSWACLENGPIRPVRINGRLAWSVADLLALLKGPTMTFDQINIADALLNTKLTIPGESIDSPTMGISELLGDDHDNN